ncbi:MAG: VWA domain-containing protein [Lentisphaeria bacterium]|nr:VWA domain-containing protein [Lentisphaeria bacterium]
MFSFAYPWLLLLLLPAALLWLYIGFFKAQPTLRFSFVAGFTRYSTGLKRRLSWLILILYGVILVLMVVALARPRLGNELVKVRAKGIDMVLALDVSGSMSAYDLPENLNLRTREELISNIRSGVVVDRLQAAEKALTAFVEKRPNDRIGLVAFGSLAYLLTPPTLDHELIYEHLKNLETGMLGDSTNIASAIVSGTRRLADRESPRRVLVLFTDGQNNVDYRITPIEAAELAKAKEVVIYTVGIGGDRSFFIQGGRVFSANADLDVSMLKAIAQTAGGKYFHASDAAALEEVMNEINALEKTSAEQPKIVEYKEYAPDLAMAVLILLAVVWTLENTIYLRCP